MKRMLINATQEEEVRVALVDGNKLYDLDIESPQHANKKANIYKGVITRIEPSLEAAFVDYGVERHGFLPIKEIAREYYPEGTDFSDHASLKTALREGQEVIVQIEKEERGQKGAALTTFISLAGSYLVLMPNNPRAGGISRRIEGEERAEIRAAFEGINIPHGMGVIIRTAGVGKSAEELSWDLSILTKLWEMIRKAASSKKAPFLIHQESSIAIRAIRDYLRPDIGEILVDSKEVYEHIVHHIKLVRPEFSERVRLYRGEIPLFSKYQIESQIESAYLREVRLPSGGAIVIDPTEALTSIDVNSAKATKGGDIEETALQTNIEAAEEIARQLRLRDVGGLVVIDFIDMSPIKNQREIENRMREACRQDRARIQFSRISRFGLLEMSRQRLRPSLEESTSHVCPMCQGQGTIRDTASLALSIMRLVEEEAHKEHTGDVMAFAPVEIATFILNNKRRQLEAIEKNTGIKVTVIPDQHMMAPSYEVHRVLNSASSLPLDCSKDDPTAILRERASRDRAKVQETMLRREFAARKQQQPGARETPMVFTEDITLNSPAPHMIDENSDDPHTINLKNSEQPRAGNVVMNDGRIEVKNGKIFSKIFSFIGNLIKGNDAQQAQPARDQDAAADSRDQAASERTERSDGRRNGNSRRNGQKRRNERPDRQERDRRKSERFERTERQSRSERPERGERPERAERQDRAERPERSERLERAERPERSERPERGERQDRAERMERNDRPERDSMDRPERSERPARQERSERPERGERPDRADRDSERLDRQDRYEADSAYDQDRDSSAAERDDFEQSPRQERRSRNSARDERNDRSESFEAEADETPVRERRERGERGERSERSERGERRRERSRDDRRSRRSEPRQSKKVPLNARTLGFNDAEVFDVASITEVRNFAFVEENLTSAPMGEGPDHEVPFAGDITARTFEEGREFRKAETTGGLQEATVCAEVATISEPAPVEIIFSIEHEDRDCDCGADFVKAERAGGLHAALRVECCEAALSMADEDAQALMDQHFNSRPQPEAAQPGEFDPRGREKAQLARARASLPLPVQKNSAQCEDLADAACDSADETIAERSDRRERAERGERQERAEGSGRSRRERNRAEREEADADSREAGRESRRSERRRERGEDELDAQEDGRRSRRSRRQERERDEREAGSDELPALNAEGQEGRAGRSRRERNEPVASDDLENMLNAAHQSSFIDELEGESDDGRPRKTRKQERAQKQRKGKGMSDQASGLNDWQGAQDQVSSDTSDDSAAAAGAASAGAAPAAPADGQGQSTEEQPRGRRHISQVYEEVDADDTSDEVVPDESPYEKSRRVSDFWSADRKDRLSARYARVMRDDNTEELDQDARTRNIRSAITETVSSFDDASVLDSTLIDSPRMAPAPADAGDDREDIIAAKFRSITASSFDYDEALSDVDTDDLPESLTHGSREADSNDADNGAADQQTSAPADQFAAQADEQTAEQPVEHPVTSAIINALPAQLRRKPQSDSDADTDADADTDVASDASTVADCDASCESASAANSEAESEAVSSAEHAQGQDHVQGQDQAPSMGQEGDQPQAETQVETQSDNQAETQVQAQAAAEADEEESRRKDMEAFASFLAAPSETKKDEDDFARSLSQGYQQFKDKSDN